MPLGYSPVVANLFIIIVAVAVVMAIVLVVTAMVVENGGRNCDCWR